MDKLNITKVNNGFLIDWEEDLKDEFAHLDIRETVLEKKVIEEINGNSDDCMKRLLDFVKEYFK